MRQAVLSTEAELIPVWAFSAQSTIAGKSTLLEEECEKTLVVNHNLLSMKLHRKHFNKYRKLGLFNSSTQRAWFSVGWTWSDEWMSRSVNKCPDKHGDDDDKQQQ